jgi:rubrerythrin
MEKFSVREVIEQAVRTEQMGYDFYTTMSEKFKEDESFRHLFDMLAEKELVHEKRFRELYDIVSDEEPEGWDDVSEYLRTFVEAEFFLGTGKALPKMKNTQSVREAVDFAISFEKETLLYFLGLRDAVKEKEIVEEIIDEEQSHIIWLNKFKSRLS